jgi:sugar phosphate isomerase/epimerase
VGVGLFAFAPASISSGESTKGRGSVIYFTKFLHGLQAEEIARLVKELGFDGLDLAVRNGQCVNPDNVREALPKAMKVWKEAGLSVPMVSTETSLVDPQHPTAEAIWTACAEMGIRNVKIGYWAWREGMSYRKLLEKARRDLEGFAKLSEKHGVRTLVHNHSGFYLACNASTLMALLQDFEPSLVGAYIDPAHLAVTGEPLPLAIEIVGDHLAMVAVKNVAYVREETAGGVKWERNWCLLRDGLVDWPAAILLLKNRGYSGPFSLHGEYSGPEERETILKNVAQDVKYLRRILE